MNKRNSILLLLVLFLPLPYLPLLKSFDLSREGNILTARFSSPVPPCRAASNEELVFCGLRSCRDPALRLVSQSNFHLCISGERVSSDCGTSLFPSSVPYHMFQCLLVLVQGSWITGCGSRPLPTNNPFDQQLTSTLLNYSQLTTLAGTSLISDLCFSE